MIGHTPVRCHRLLFVLALAIALSPVVAQAQVEGYGFAACISRADQANRVLTAPAAMNVGVRPDLQTIKACADFCKTGRAEQGVEVRGDRSQFRAPYRYALLSGGWCFCGSQIGGAPVADGLCNLKRNCLASPEALKSRCYFSQEPDHMVVDLNPPPGGGGVIGGGGGGGGTPTLQPPPSTGNRRPNPPTVQPGGYEPPFPLQYEGAYQMTWRNNGDPDGDRLTFGVIIFQYDWTGRRWMQTPGIRDQYGTYGMTWLTDDVYTFTMQNGLSPRTHYAWMVFACDLGKGDAALCSWSGWGLFRTQ